MCNVLKVLTSKGHGNMSFLWPRVESAFKFTSNLLLIIENKLHVDVTVCAVFDMCC